MEGWENPKGPYCKDQSTFDWLREKGRPPLPSNHPMGHSNLDGTAAIKNNTGIEKMGQGKFIDNKAQLLYTSSL